MSLAAILDRVYGPFSYRTCREKVAEYVLATGDEPDRWIHEAPPSLAGAMLFVVAPSLLADPDVALHARSVIHGEQTFEWSRPIPIEADLEVAGRVTRARERGGVWFVGFELAVRHGSESILGGSSLFLLSGGVPPAGSSAEEEEPPPLDGGFVSTAVDHDTFVEMHRSASRADLVRYAAASRDWNPIHWDHDSATAAGLPGVVVHGLLQSAWLVQATTRAGNRPGSARFRYRAPLRPAARVMVSGAATEAGHELQLVGADGVVHVTAAVLS
jgi:acyl dehydratase